MTGERNAGGGPGGLEGLLPAGGNGHVWSLLVRTARDADLVIICSRAPP
jgi:hypothetical protein